MAYRNFNTNDGLPSNESYFAFQDKDGYIWICTDHGVARYNGYQFTQYTTNNGLTDNTIFSIKQDKKGRLWFLTYTGGICYYDGVAFHAHPMNDTIIALMGAGVATSWEVLDDQTIWLGVIRTGFYRIDKNSCHYYLVEKPGSGEDTSTLAVINFSDGGIVYSMLPDKVQHFDKYKEINSVAYYAISRTDLANASVNFATQRLQDGRMLVAIATRLLLISPQGTLSYIQWPRGVMATQIRTTPDGNIWSSNVNTPPYCISVAGNRLTIIDSLSVPATASGVMLDNNRNYWVTTINKGVFMIPDKNIKRFTCNDIEPDVKVSALLPGAGKIYAGLPKNTLLSIDNGFKHTQQARRKESAGVSDICLDGNGEPFTNLDAGYWGNIEFYIAHVENIGNNQYLAGGSGGFMHAQNSSTLFKSPSIGFDKRVTAIGSLNAGNHCIGTINGLYYFTIPQYKLTKEPMLGDVRITACRTYNPNLYAVATRGIGIMLCINNKKFMLDESRGLVSNLVEDVYFQSDSQCWVGSYKGLSKVRFRMVGDSLVTHIRCYSQEDGLNSDQVNAITGFNNYIWLATNEGLTYFRPDNFIDDTLLVPLYFTGVSVNGEKYSPDSLNLTYDHNNLLIEFNALYYKALGNVRYKVRLNGLNNWTYTDRNSMQYLGLPAGDYTFEVAAEDKYGRYKSQPHQLKFSISPRFTDTVTFKAIVVFIIVFIAAVIVYLIFRYQQLKARNVIKLLQTEFKALNYQINPHFIFNVLNSIQYYILRQDTTKAVHFLSSFSTLIRRIVTNSKQQFASVLEEIECLKEYLDLERLRLENKFNYEINIDSAVNIEDKIILPMIIQPLVENAIWHGIVPSPKPGMVKVDFKMEGAALVCIVDDNGVGIKSKADKPKKSENNLSLAMSNVEERLKIMSELNGSAWYIRIQDKSDLGISETGTVVSIKFPLQKKH